MTHESFEANVTRMRSKLLAIARSKLPQNEAEDAVQNAVLSAWKHLDQLKDDKAFAAWIRQILVNECVKMLREQKKRRQIDISIIEHVQSPHEENTPPLHDALGEMSAEERELLMLHHAYGYSVAELSDKLGKSEDVVKMRLYRARKRLRIILISLLILLLSMAVAIGTGLLDVKWFFENRRAVPTQVSTDHKSDISIAYDGQYLAADAVDAVWDTDTFTLHFTYSLTGLAEDAVLVHSGNIGVDGERMDHIWIDNQILPVEQWANGQTVYTYYLDGWKLNNQFLSASEDFLPDGKGESFIASIRFSKLKPEQRDVILTSEDALALESDVFVQRYGNGELLEHGVLRAHVFLPKHIAAHIEAGD